MAIGIGPSRRLKRALSGKRIFHLEVVETPGDTIKGQAVFGNIVTAVYSAITKEISTKGKESSFKKTDRGRFARA